jgi:hypothetical protein
MVLMTVPLLVQFIPRALLAAALLRHGGVLVPVSTQPAMVPCAPVPVAALVLSDEENAVIQLRHALLQAGLESACLWGVQLTAESGAPLLRQFLRARRWSVDEARRMLQGTLRWRRENGVDELASVESFGDGMPADRIIGGGGAGPLVLATLPGRAALTDVKRFVRWRIAMQEAAIRTLCLTESAPAFTLVMDVSNLRRFHLSKEMRCCTAELSRIIQSYYPCFLARLLVVNTPPAFSCAWSLLRPVLPPALLRSVQLQRGPADCFANGHGVAAEAQRTLGDDRRGKQTP